MRKEKGTKQTKKRKTTKTFYDSSQVREHLLSRNKNPFAETYPKHPTNIKG